jgi:hypothetical protein
MISTFGGATRNAAAAFFFLYLLAEVARAAGGSLTADEIVKRAVNKVYAPSEQSTYVMRLIDNGGAEKTRRMRVWFKRDGDAKARLLIKFAEPADIRGTGLLSIVEKEKAAEQWLYLPAYKKTRRIKGGNESESFLGSDFTVGDLSAEGQDHYSYTLTGVRPCGDGECYVLTGAPKSAEAALELPYQKKELEIRKDNFVTVSARFYAQDGKLEKILELKGMRQAAGGQWMAEKTEMKNLATGHRTVIEVEKRDTATAPSDAMFTTSALERG